MGKQCNFFANKQDLNGFIDLISKERIDIIENKVYNDLGLMQKIKAHEFNFDSIDGFCFLVPPEISTNVFSFSSINEAFFIRSTYNPIIEFMPSKINKNQKLELGRIYIDYQGDPELEKTTLKYFKLLCKYFKEWKRTSKYKYLVGPNVYDEILCGKIEMSTLDTLT